MSTLHHVLPIVLVVDDDHDFCTIVDTKLRDICQLITADNMEDATARMTQSNPDLMILSNNLPDGLSAAQVRIFRKKYPFLKIIMVSANADPTLRRQTMEAGVNLFLVKPFSIQQLRKSILDELKMYDN